jgi:hypothetical protein
MTDVSTRSVATDAASPLEIKVTDRWNGSVGQATIDAWELHQARIALALLKERLRGEAMTQLLAPEIAAADERAREIAAASNGEWGDPVESVLDVRGLTSDLFLEWLNSHLMDEAAMEAGNPDHYEVRPEVAVTETFAGIPTRFKFNMEPCERPAHFRRNPDFPRDVTAGAGAFLATLLDGTTPVALSAGMQIRDEDDGFAIKLTVFFPKAAPAEMLEHHSRHYAIEFSRWIAMAHAAKRLGRE